MASVLSSNILIFSARVTGAGNIEPPGFLDDPQGIVESVARIQAGFYQIMLKNEIDVQEIDVNVNPSGFDANPPDYNTLPVVFQSYIGTLPHLTGFFIGIGRPGVGLDDHDFQITVSQIRIVE